MALTSEEQKTIQYYDEHAGEWAQKHGMADPSNYKLFDPEMKLLFKLRPTGKVLEIGTGHGGDAIELIAQYGVENYVGIDASTGLLKIARSRNPGADLRQQNIYEMSFPDEIFDVFWISAMLIHVHKNKLQNALKNVRRVVKPGGIGFVSVMEGNADMEESRP